MRPGVEVLYEDAALLFINKPAGIVVQQRMHEPGEVFLLDLVEKQFGPVYLMQRLDRGTSGVMFFSRLSNINVRLTRQFERKRIRKRYLALCEGELRERQTIDAPLARIGAIKFGVREHGKRAITHLEPVEATPNGSLLQIVLETGRTHQIRVHLAAIGHPLAGDWLYGDRNAVRPMLHASELEMMHPLTNEPLRVAAPVPDDFREEAQRRGISSLTEDRPTSERAS
jgi:23S rRNA pseudouridine1911/1915/1917 synthase